MPKKLLLFVPAIGLIGVLLTACGGGSASGPTPTGVLSPVKARYLPVVISSDLSVGPNRFLLGLQDQQQNDAPIGGAKLHLRFFDLEGQDKLKFEADPKAITVTKSFTELHPGATPEVHQAGDIGAYVADVRFDAAGRWGVEVTGTVNGQQMEAVRPIFSVNQKSAIPSVGDPAPRSQQKILADGVPIADLDTSEVPNPDMHNMRIAEAVASGKATVVVFATPAFCQSQICGPTKDAVDQLFQAYKGQANFVHVEPYDVVKMRNGKCPSLYECRNPVMDDWGLTTEPWVFMVDKQGKIAARFEAIVTYPELEASLKALLG